jgi:hypothetical protein
MIGASFALLPTLLMSSSVYAIAVSGQGTWELTLQARNLDGDPTTVEAYYDTLLNITWLADANYAMTSGSDADGQMDWDGANLWAANQTIGGFDGWRLPTMSPIDGVAFNTTRTNNATSDSGYAYTTTDGTDGGWRDGGGTPVSELGHMFYVTLGNLGFCEPNDAQPNGCGGRGADFGLVNTGLFTNLQDSFYWTDTEQSATTAWFFDNYYGDQNWNATNFKDGVHFAWAVHSGDVGTSVVPIPAAVWLFCAGLLGLGGIARRRATARDLE